MHNPACTTCRRTCRARLDQHNFRRRKPGRSSSSSHASDTTHHPSALCATSEPSASTLGMHPRMLMSGAAYEVWEQLRQLQRRRREYTIAAAATTVCGGGGGSSGWQRRRYHDGHSRFVCVS